MAATRPLLGITINAFKEHRVDDDKLGQLLLRTAAFHSSVHRHVGALTLFDDDRCLLAFQAGILSLEHATAVLVLLNHDLSASAYTLMRPQFECLVRGIWAFHAAKDEWVEKLTKPLTVESAKRANEGPMLAKMLEELDASPNAPRPIVAQLRVYRDVAWKAMSSYTHGGLHPLARTVAGYPLQLTYDVLRNSNAVVALSAQLMSILSGDPSNMEPVRLLHTEFADVLPLIGREEVKGRPGRPSGQD